MRFRPYLCIYYFGVFCSLSKNIYIYFFFFNNQLFIYFCNWINVFFINGIINNLQYLLLFVIFRFEFFKINLLNNLISYILDDIKNIFFLDF